MTDSMSDEEIRENLLKLGQNIGPVVDSTRAFYRRKLAKLLGEVNDEPASHGSETEGTASENEANEEKEEQIEQKLFSDSYLPPTQIRGRRSINHEGSPKKSSFRSSSTFSPEGQSDDFNPPGQTADKKNIVMMLCFIFGSALILYLILFHNYSTETAIESN